MDRPVIGLVPLADREKESLRMLPAHFLGELGNILRLLSGRIS